MDNTIFSLHSWPQAILHIDGDAFFTSCEEILHPELKGKPIITGAERCKHALHLGGSHVIEVLGKGKRGEATVRESTQFFGETKRQHLGLPILHVKV